ncbi:MAG: hypothetical protein ACK50U_10060 [Acidobacteriota bacterium]
MNFQPQFRQLVLGISQETHGIGLLLEIGHKIVSVANDEPIP